MKGVVFCEFLDFVEHVAGEEIVDRMIDSAKCPSGAAYTAVGRYDFAELASLIAALSAIVNRPAPALIRDFGRHLFGRLAVLHPEFLDAAEDPLDLLEAVEDHIHVEVKKLYPDAELPSLRPTRLGVDAIVLEYQSCRPLGELCVGLIEGCAAHFSVPLAIEAVPRPGGLQITVRRGERCAVTVHAEVAHA